MAEKIFEPQVSSMYSEYPFPKRNQFGIDKMNKDFKENLNKLGLDISDFKNKKVMDAGCGTGELALFMARSGALVEGIDISDGSLEYARRKAQEAQVSNLIFTKRSLFDGEFPPEHYDYIVSHMVLHHTEDAKKSFSNISKALKPGGGIFIRVFFLWGRMSFFQKTTIWKVWLVQLLGGNSVERKVKLGEKLFYKEGNEISHGLDKYTYLHDCYGIPQVTHHSFGEALRWFDENNIEYVSSSPPMEFNKLVDLMLFNDKKSITVKGRILKMAARAILTIFPLHKTSWARRSGLFSRFLSQTMYAMFFGTDMFNIYGIKRKAL